MRGSGKDSGATRLKKAGAGEVQEGKNKFVAPEMIILRRKGESDSTVTYEVLAVSLLGEQEISKDALKQGTLLRGQKVAAVEAVSEDREGLMRKAREAIKKDPEKWKHSRAWGRTTTQVEELYKAYGIKYQSDIAALLKGVTETTVWRNFKKLKLESGSDIEEKKTWGVISAELAKLPEGVKPNARKMARDTGIPNTTIISQLKKHEVERHNPGGREKTEEESGKYKGNKKGNDTWAKIKPFVEESIRSGTKINGSEITRRLNDKSVSLDMTLYHIRKRKEEIKEMQAKAGTEEPVAREEQKTDKRKARGDATWNKIKPFVEESIYNGAELDVSKITKRLGDEKISRAVVRYHIGKREKEIEMMRAEFEVGKIEESGSRTASGSIVTTAVVEKTGEKEIKTPGLSKDEEAKLDASASKGLVKGVGLSEDSGVSYHKTKKYMKAHGIEIKRGRARGKSTKEIGMKKWCKLRSQKV
jgi:biotin operon repressor